MSQRREILRSALLEKFQKAYGKNDQKHYEMIDFLINEYFN